LPVNWRYERPQRGRLREFWQLNVDLFGVESLEADAEIIQVADSVLKALGAKPEMYQINVNSRAAMVAAMKSFALEEEELKRVYRIIDKMPRLTKEEGDQILRENLSEEKAQKLLSYLGSDEPPANVRRLLELLRASGVTNAVYEPSVVRGLEYYTDIVFEVFDNDPENARAMFGGGRYDGLVGLFGVDPVPTVGFGMGDVTLRNFLETHGLLPELTPETDAVAILIGEVYDAAQKGLAELRSKGLKIAVDSTERKLDSKIKSAAKSGVKYALFIGKDELDSDNFKLKNLETGDEKTAGIDSIVSTLRAK
jgi:histidyl-tRNA synthetase